MVTTNPRPTQGLLQKKNKYFIFTTGTWQKQEYFSFRGVERGNNKP